MKNAEIKKTDKQITGMKGEDVARLFLEQKGYKIKEKNFRVATGEIDIIAEKDEYIIFVEVKTRSSKKFGSASQSVGYKKRRSIISAAKVYLALHTEETERRQPQFDVVEVYIDKNTGKNYVSHIKCAFIT